MIMQNLSLSSSSSPGLSIQNPNRWSIIHSLSSLNAFTATPLNPKTFSFSKTTPPHRTLSVKCRHSNHFEQQQRFDPIPPPVNKGMSMPPRVFVRHSIYKGNGVLLMEPRSPEFSLIDSGAFKLSREGFVVLQFAPASGVRHYDWDRKQVFSLSVSEMGTLIKLGARESCEFFHDPSIGKSDEGKVRKLLKVEPLPDGSGHVINLSVQNKIINAEESIYIPVSKAEYTILISLFNFIVPHLLGWHIFANSIKPEDALRVNHANPRSGTDLNGPEEHFLNQMLGTKLATARATTTEKTAHQHPLQDQNSKHQHL